MENSTKQLTLTGAPIFKFDHLYLVKNPNMSAKIISYTEHSGGLFSKSYILYKIVLFPYNVEIQRRYSDFSKLRDYLTKSYPELIIPPIPKKQTSNKTSKAIHYRQYALETFLNLVIQGFWYDPIVNVFFESKTEKELERVEKVTITRKPEVNQFETLNGQIDIKINQDIDFYYQKLPDHVIENSKVYKKIRQLSKKVIQDHETLKKDLKDLGECFTTLQENQKNFSNQVKLELDLSMLENSKNFCTNWGNKLDLVNLNIERSIWHTFKYQSQIEDIFQESLKYREQVKETYTKQLQSKNIQQSLDEIQNNFGYINNQIYQQLQLAMKFEFQKVQQELTQLTRTLSWLYADFSKENLEGDMNNQQIQMIQQQL